MHSVGVHGVAKTYWPWRLSSSTVATGPPRLPCPATERFKATTPFERGEKQGAGVKGEGRKFCFTRSLETGARPLTCNLAGVSQANSSRLELYPVLLLKPKTVP
ncbi:hypothetical protein C0Q70_12816 [Pomacea canaliculata]|uniref:Uncharacterized protein n=1 Tax=Pomacea canaliculata TaxID=400727 RepID=A0A2T7P2K1_POMCA|nr:hypothetical protein C0Q70_12816 [Pomacea canaliculata]